MLEYRFAVVYRDRHGHFTMSYPTEQGLDQATANARKHNIDVLVILRDVADARGKVAESLYQLKGQLV